LTLYKHENVLAKTCAAPRRFVKGYFRRKNDKNSSGDETANVNFYAVRPEATRIR